MNHLKMLPIPRVYFNITPKETKINKIINFVNSKLWIF